MRRKVISPSLDMHDRKRPSLPDGFWGKERERRQCGFGVGMAGGGGGGGAKREGPGEKGGREGGRGGGEGLRLPEWEGDGNGS